MDNRAEIREFLTTRRAKITPSEAGLPAAGHRRVPGLRRAEVAVLAGVSAEYYAKIERGALAGVSPSVLDALGRALHLDEAERRHLEALARAAGTSTVLRSRRPVSPRSWRPHPSLQWALDAFTGGPAIVRNGRMDLLATNSLGWAMHSALYASPAAHAAGGPPNFARFTFLDDDSHGFYVDWEAAARTCVAILRTEAGRTPHDKGLHDLVGELSTRSAVFGTLWSAHDVRLHGVGAKTFHHDAVGNLELAYEGLEMLSAPGLHLTLYSAEPGSPTAQALALLATWSATEHATRDTATITPG